VSDAKLKQVRKGEFTLKGFKNFDTKDIAEVQKLFGKALKRQQQFRDTNDMKQEIVVTGLQSFGDTLSVKYRTKINRLSHKAAKIEKVMPLDENDFVDALQDLTSQTLAKKIDLHAIEIINERDLHTIKPMERKSTVAPNTGGLSNVQGNLTLEGISKSRINRSPKILTALRETILKAVNTPELELPIESVSITSIRTQVDKSIKLNYKIDLQGGTTAAADAAVSRLVSQIDPLKNKFMEDAKNAAIDLKKRKMELFEKIKLKSRHAERVEAISKIGIKSAAAMIDATRKMLMLSKSVRDDPEQFIGDDGLVESRRSRRRKSRIAESIKRTESVDIAADTTVDDEAQVLERRLRRKQRGERRKKGEGKSSSNHSDVAKIGSRRERRRDSDKDVRVATDSNQSKDRKSRKERRSRRDSRTDENDSAAGRNSRSSRRRERRSRKEQKSAKIEQVEEPTAIPQKVRNRWSSLKTAVHDGTAKEGNRHSLRLRSIESTADSDDMAGTKKKSGKMLRSTTSRAFEETTDVLMKQIRETKAERAAAESKKRTGLGGVGRRRRKQRESKSKSPGGH
jgi:hypothetical protein